MAAIALAESGGDPRAKHRDADGSIDRGLWQINSVHGYGDASFVPIDNAREAVTIERSQGLGAWSTYVSGAYKRFMRGSGRTAQTAAPSSWGVLGPSHFAGVDQGVDFSGAGPIPALGDGRVTDVGTSGILEGGTYPVVVYQLDNPPPASSGFVYVAENFSPAVRKRQRVKLGQSIGEAAGRYPFIEVGWNKGPTGWDPVAPLDPNPHGAKQAGRDMWNFIRSVEGGSLIPGVPGTGTSVTGTRTRPGTGSDGGGWLGDAWGGFEGAVASGAGDVGSLFGDVTGLISGPLDFLKAALWLVNPLNWLRAFEAIVGVGLIAASVAIFVGADKAVEQIAGAAGSKIPPA